MRLSLFKTRRRFITSFSEEETISAVQEMLSSKSKFLFITIHHYFGHVKGREFRFCPSSNYQTRLLAPMIKGQIRNDHPTVVDLNFQLPIIPGFFLLVLPWMFIPSLLFTDEMTINGVLREPTMNERIGFALFIAGIPALLYYTNFIRPLQKLFRALKKKLKLEEHPMLPDQHSTKTSYRQSVRY